MSQAAWQKMFATLEAAEVNYVSLHRMLTAFFSSRGCGADSDALADVTLDRLARKIDEGVKVQNFLRYTKIIAGRVYKEYCKDREKFRAAAWELERLRGHVQDPNESPDLRRRCQELCVSGLTETERQLMLDYYVTGKDRSVLAEELGLLIATLRSRIHRLKTRLNNCVENCRRSA